MSSRPDTPDKVRALAGATFKLESPNGSLLGTVAVPDYWADILRKQGFMHFTPPLDISVFPTGNEISRYGTLARSYGRHPDALMLVGMSLEVFEKIEGCSFSPSAAYLRSIVS